MKKSSLSLSLLVAGVMATAGAVHAQASPDTIGSSTEMPDVGTMGAGPAVVYTETTTYSVPVYTYIEPAGSAAHEQDRGGASETSAVPGRSGEASTMTGGVPNMSTDNLPGHVFGPR